MADAAPHWTPFRYGFNNPITVTDPTGMKEIFLTEDKVGDEEMISWGDPDLRRSNNIAFKKNDKKAEAQPKDELKLNHYGLKVHRFKTKTKSLFVAMT